jgi:nucleoside-diphosphate-sugar epimerase
MKILITGGNGFIGKNFFERIKTTKKLTIKILSRKNNSNVDKKKIIKLSKNLKTVKKKLKKFSPDIVIHFATFYSTERSLLSQKKMIESNILFGSNLLEIINLKKLKAFIYTNSYSIYDSQKKYNPKNFYSVTKYMFEFILKYYSKLYNFKVINLLLSDVYGQRDKRGKFINLLINAYKKNKNLNASPGYQKINLLHVEDLIDAIIILIKKIKILNKWSNFSVFSKEVLSLRELKKKFDKIYKKKIKVNFGFYKYRENEDMNFRPKFSKVYGWEPKINIEHGIKKI